MEASGNAVRKRGGAACSTEPRVLCCSEVPHFREPSLMLGLRLVLPKVQAKPCPRGWNPLKVHTGVRGPAPGLGVPWEPLWQGLWALLGLLPHGTQTTRPVGVCPIDAWSVVSPTERIKAGGHHGFLRACLCLRFFICRNESVFHLRGFVSKIKCDAG